MNLVQSKRYHKAAYLGKCAGWFKPSWAVSPTFDRSPSPFGLPMWLVQHWTHLHSSLPAWFSSLHTESLLGLSQSCMVLMLFFFFTLPSSLIIIVLSSHDLSSSLWMQDSESTVLHSPSACVSIGLLHLRIHQDLRHLSKDKHYSFWHYLENKKIGFHRFEKNWDLWRCIEWAKWLHNYLLLQ